MDQDFLLIRKMHHGDEEAMEGTGKLLEMLTSANVVYFALAVILCPVIYQVYRKASLK